jgi:hypothetical protein
MAQLAESTPDPLSSPKPTVAQYNDALEEALKHAGYLNHEVATVMKGVRANQLLYGFTPNKPVLKVPGRTALKGISR